MSQCETWHPSQKASGAVVIPVEDIPVDVTGREQIYGAVIVDVAPGDRMTEAGLPLDADGGGDLGEVRARLEPVNDNLHSWWYPFFDGKEECPR